MINRFYLFGGQSSLQLFPGCKYITSRCLMVLRDSVMSGDHCLQPPSTALKTRLINVPDLINYDGQSNNLFQGTSGVMKLFFQLCKGIFIHCEWLNEMCPKSGC